MYTHPMIVRLMSVLPWRHGLAERAVAPPADDGMPETGDPAVDAFERGWAAAELAMANRKGLPIDRKVNKAQFLEGWTYMSQLCRQLHDEATAGEEWSIDIVMCLAACDRWLEEANPSTIIAEATAPRSKARAR
jgi:hypothetical protein